ncbi:Armadillo-like helical [Penicillium verhagenii]|uniref:Armadillo-like helical n=1 Tax=Penicillium verhagenii TaxID=1562060 RepID=UPI0025454874|nr:Armadillo-like helical [Penicillium verhagenii]KAJ5915385.1 Armadillo-like helical [Penicillium verhagenii]
MYISPPWRLFPEMGYFGISLFFAVRGIVTDLRQVSDLTEIKQVDREDKIISEGTEDALKLDTLLKLSSSTSHDLRAAALRIIAERSTKDETREILLDDLSSKNKARQGRALTGLHFLVSNRALSRTSVCARLRDLPAYTAIINCLCNFLEEHTEVTYPTTSPVLARTRPLGEKKALQILNILLPENVPAALEAGLVTRWLTKYPFPCVLDEPSRRRDVVVLLKTWWSDDTVMSSIVNNVTSHAEGIKQLRKHGLMGSMIEEETEQDEDGDGDDEEEDSDVWMVNGEDTAGSYRGSSSRRPQEGNADEQALRRRRREAMVLSEGGRPLGRDDIIQRPL